MYLPVRTLLSAVNTIHKNGSRNNPLPFLIRYEVILLSPTSFQPDTILIILCYFVDGMVDQKHDAHHGVDRLIMLDGVDKNRLEFSIEPHMAAHHV